VPPEVQARAKPKAQGQAVTRAPEVSTGPEVKRRLPEGRIFGRCRQKTMFCGWRDCALSDAVSALSLCEIGQLEQMLQVHVNIHS